MIVLSATTRKIQVVLGGVVATNQAQCYAAWRDITTTTYVPGDAVVLTNNTTDVDLVAAPASSTQRVIDRISVFNNDSATITVRVKLDVSGTDTILARAVLAVNELLEFSEGSGWRVLTADGAVKGLGATGPAGVNGLDGVMAVEQAEIDFGATPVDEMTFTVAAVGVLPTSKLVVILSGEATADADADENEMDSIVVHPVADTDQFFLYARCLTGAVHGKRKINYMYS